MKYSWFLASPPFKVFFHQKLIHISLCLSIVCFVFFSIVFFVCESFADDQKTSFPKRNVNAEHMTHSLGVLLARYLRASPPEQEKMNDDLIALATERKAVLASIIEENPGEVLRLSLPGRLRAAMPAAVKNHLEKQLELVGTLELFYEDYKHTSRLRHVLKANGKRFSLHFKVQPPKVHSGVRVRVRGVKVDGAIALESGETNLEILALDDEGSVGSGGASNVELPNTVGEQRTLVLLVNFQDDPANQPWTVEEARNLVFGTVSDFYWENSFGQTWLTGDVFGWYTLPIQTTTVCNQYSIANEAKSAATAAGVDLSTYNHILYVFPKNSCTWSGLSTVGGSPSESWICNDFILRVVAHEFGHGFGLFHSQGLDCTPGILGSDCRKLAYGDTLDIMGGRAAHLNAFQKERLGWLNFGASPPIAVVEAEGTYLVAPIETDGTQPRALKVLKSVDPATGDKTWYYLEYRQAIGFDSWMSGDPYLNEVNVINGVVLHLGTEYAGDSSLLLDMTPDSPSTYGDLYDPALMLGQTYSDPNSGLTISTEWTDGSTAGVSVSFAQTGCVHANPTVDLFPSVSQWVAAGTTVSYSVTMANNDPFDCSAAQFNLSASLPSGWAAAFEESTLILTPGATGSTNLTLTSPATAADGFYDLSVTAANNADPAYAGSAVVTYVIGAPTVNGAPVAVDDIAILTQVQPIVIDILFNDWDPDNDAIWLEAVTQGVKGTVELNDDCTLTYRPGKMPRL
jgi:hypothetical protein